MRLPSELGMGKGVVARLDRCMHGTRDAGAIWESLYVAALTKMGFSQGLAPPCCFHHALWNISVVAHGDDFTALGTASSLDLYEHAMQQAFDVKLRGRLGHDPHDAKEVRVLNRIVRVVDTRRRYEANPRHVELPARAMNVENAKPASCPGYKPQLLEDPHPDEQPEPDALEDLVATFHSGRRSRQKICFGKTEIVTYNAVHRQAIPKNALLTGKIGSSADIGVDTATCDVFTGLPYEDVLRMKQSLLSSFDPNQRSRDLSHYLKEGAAWENQTTQIAAALVKKDAFKQKRKSEHAKQRLKTDCTLLLILKGGDATCFRALAARANYLALDRPDIAFVRKELCRSFSCPSRSSATLLKRLVRYLVGCPRPTWAFDHQPADDTLQCDVDTYFAGCLVTRRSTSGGIARRGGHLIKHWSQTQGAVSLSSAEAELGGIRKRASQGLGLVSIAKDLGIAWSLQLVSDATAATGVCRRRGLGKIRHLATADLWVQDRLRCGDFSLAKIPGAANPAGILTKHIERPLLFKHLQNLNLHFETGRVDSAPEIDVASHPMQFGLVTLAAL